MVGAGYNVWVLTGYYYHIFKKQIVYILLSTLPWQGIHEQKKALFSRAFAGLLLNPRIHIRQWTCNRNWINRVRTAPYRNSDGRIRAYRRNNHQRGVRQIPLCYPTNLENAVWDFNACKPCTTTVFASRFISMVCILNGRKVVMKILWIEKRMKI